MTPLVFVLCLVFCASSLVGAQVSPPEVVAYQGTTYPLYPAALEDIPDMPSPYRAADGSEYVVGITSDGRYTIFCVTVANREDPEEVWYTQGRQLVVDTADFPALAATGLHSEAELTQTESITGRSVQDIADIGRPGQHSGQGFIASDEDILSVLVGDNRLVRRMGLTHPELARPVFHVCNVIQTVMGDLAHVKRGDQQTVLYNDHEVHLKFQGSKGWQESIFADEILGYWEIEMWRELDRNERTLLSNHCAALSTEARSQTFHRLSHIHTGDMVAYYIMRYGFYEGHSGYRADPVVIASVFGLRTLEDIGDVFGSDLRAVLSDHHVGEH